MKLPLNVLWARLACELGNGGTIVEDSLLDKDEDKDIADILSDGTDTQPNQKEK